MLTRAAFPPFPRYNPIYLADKASGFKEKNFVAKAMGELVDLVTRYEPEVIWSDGDWEAPDSYWDAPTNFLAWLTTNSSVKDTVVYNDRWGDGDSCKHGSFYSCQVRARSVRARSVRGCASAPGSPRAHALSRAARDVRAGLTTHARAVACRARRACAARAPCAPARC